MIKAGEESIYYISGNKRFVIPFFQRKYVWNNENWEDLWEALMSDDETNFLGSLILKDNGNKDDINEFSVIDGQQRLTTLSILIRAINDGFLNCNGTDPTVLDEDVKKSLFNISEKWIDGPDGKPIKDTSYSIKLINSNFDKKYYDDVINGLHKADYTNYIPYDENNPRVISCYAYFMDKIITAVNNNEHSKLQGNLINKLKVDGRKSLVVITIGENDHEQEIFDTINSAGVRLTSSDIIKNNLFNALVSLYKANPLTKDKALDKTKDIYDKTWLETFEKDESIVNRWLSKTSKGRRERTYLELFLQSYAIIKKIYNPTEKGQKLEKLSDYYKQHVKEFALNDTIDFINNICEYAVLYKQYFIELKEDILLHGLKFKDEELSDDENEIKHIIQMIAFMETNTFDAYILSIIHDGVDIQKKLKELETYIMRNYISQQNTDKNYNKESFEIMFNPEHDIKYFLDTNGLNDSKMLDSIKNIKNDPAKLVLMWAEMYMTFEANSDNDLIKAVKDSYQLEHVLPQNSKEDKWPVDYLTVDDAGNELSDDAKERNHNEALFEQNQIKYEIGNMTLLTSKKNAEFQNESFENKKNGYKNKRNKFIEGYKKCSKLMITSYVNEADVWDKEAIDERTNIIYDYIVNKLWPVDKSIFTNTISKTVSNDFDINDESTFSNIKVGKLAYNLISDLMSKNKLTDDEIQKLITKEYCRTNFKQIVYPILAYNKTDNMGDSDHIRYYKDPVQYHDCTYFISHEWFENSRSDLVNWYKQHLD